MSYKQCFIPKIAILNSLPFHYECLGFLLENYKGYNITFYTSCNDKFNWILYWKSLYNFQVVNISKFKLDMINSFIYTFKITSGTDNCFKHKKNIQK